MSVNDLTDEEILNEVPWQGSNGMNYVLIRREYRAINVYGMFESAQSAIQTGLDKGYLIDTLTAVELVGVDNGKEK